LENVPLMNFNKSLMRNECLQFFYMHYLQNSDDEMELLNLFSGYRSACNKSEDPKVVVAALNAIVNSSALERRLNKDLN